MNFDSWSALSKNLAISKMKTSKWQTSSKMIQNHSTESMMIAVAAPKSKVKGQASALRVLGHQRPRVEPGAPSIPQQVLCRRAVNQVYRHRSVSSGATSLTLNSTNISTQHPLNPTLLKHFSPTITILKSTTLDLPTPTHQRARHQI